MASLSIKYLATSVMMQMHFRVFVPDAAVVGRGAAGARALKVLWLLHPEGGDCTDWLRLSMVEHSAERAGIALVMPNMDHSMCMDMAHGGYPYFAYLKDDLPAQARDTVRLLSPRPEDNFVAGISTAGHGAAKWLLRAPEMFTAAACISGEIDMAGALRRLEEADALPDSWAAAFGSSERVAGSDDDVLHLGRSGSRGEIHVYSGIGEAGRERNREAVAALRGSGVDIRLHEKEQAPGWPFWDAAVEHFIATVVVPGGGAA